MMRILIDLDIVTNALWKGGEKELATEFLERVKLGEFEVYTPYTLFELIKSWKNKNLADKIFDFYKLYSKEIITVEKLLEKIRKTNIVFENLSTELTKIINKVEDSDLVLICSIFELDFLVTLNRKHLRNNKEKILQFLKENVLKSVEVVLPNEL